MLTLRDIGVLAAITHLAGVSLEDVDLLAGRLTLVELESGQPLIEEGADDDSIVIVLEGEVSIGSGSGGRPGGRGGELNRVGPGAMLGLLALVDNAPRSATCLAVGSVRAARLTREAYRAVTAASPTLALAFHRALGSQLARDLRNVSAQLAEEPAGRPAARIAEDAQREADCDVAVIGAGPLGMMYAQWLRRMHPAARVVMLERRDVPGYKVGESTLSTTVRAILDMGFTMPQLRRLFGNKAGIRFWWAGEVSERPEREVDVVDIEETFQVERRVFEMALQRLTRESGVDLRTGTQVELESSDLDGPIKRIACEGPEGEYLLSARIICDATGPAAALPRHLGVYRKDASLYDTFQTNTYFAYFRQTKPVPLARWQDPATRHLCTPQGWVWFITLHSWESADDATIGALVDDVMDHTSDDDAELPSRRELAARHGADFSLLTSIGITVREDMDSASELPIEQRFEHYVQRYPALAWILEHYELVERPYREKRRPYAAFLGLVHDSTQIAGDGWVSIGDSAQFTNPLFSLGMNYGSGMAYMAAASTAKALTTDDTSRAAFAAYERYGGEILSVLLQETDFFYRSWAGPVPFEQTLMTKFHFGALDVTQRGVYTETDPYVFDVLNPVWLDIVDRVREVEKRYEIDGDVDGMAAAIGEITEPFNAECRVKAGEIGLDLGRILTNFDSDARRHEGRDKPRGYFRAYQCPTCDLWQDDTLVRCPVCGTDNPDRHVEAAGSTADTGPANGAPLAPAGGELAVPPPAGMRTRTVQEESPEPAALRTTAGPERSDRRRFRPLRVAWIRRETAQARTIAFEVPAGEQERFRYAPGQFLTLQAELDGELLTRCYSLSSSPSSDELPAITVKRIEGGRMSNWLCDGVGVGDVLDVRPPDGRFTVPDRPGDLYLFAAGSGITPVWSIVQEAFATTDRRLRLVYVNRNPEETILRSAIHGLRDRAGSRRFRLIERIGGREGRLDTRDVQAYCNDRTDGLFFVCGPWGFMDVVEEGLLDMGVEPEAVHVERFASPRQRFGQTGAGASSAQAPALQIEAPASAASSSSMVTVDLFGERHELRCAFDQTLTEAAIAADVSLPSSCEEGYCGTCMCRLDEGEVALDVDDALSKGQRKRGMVLACQARPRSPTLRIAYE